MGQYDRFDYTGKRYGSLVAVKKVKVNNHGNTSWLFKCDCGATVVRQYSNVAHGAKVKRTVSCGCGVRKTKSKAKLDL